MWQKQSQKHRHIVTNPCCRLADRFSIIENDDNVGYVATITCCWSQHWRTNVGKCCSRIGATSWVTEGRDGWLDRSDCRMIAQVKAGAHSRRKRDKTDACVTAVDVQSSDKIRQEPLHLGEIAWPDTSRFVHQENDVWRTVQWRS